MPRFVLFFKGPSFHSPTVTPTTSLDQLSRSRWPPLAPHIQDLILFKGMSILGGSPKTDGYQEEHAAGLIGCATGEQLPLLEERLVLRLHGQRVDRHRDRQPLSDRAGAGGAALLQPAPGAGAQSDADNVGLGQRYVS